ncbi:MAG TPA: response regulator transcription factor, partial [Polyangiales bacterium]|nr:response regulator transcription factor [Polyangiales bacterium]
KPFSPRELVARVAAVLRRMQPVSESESTELLQHAGLAMDVQRHRCTFQGKELVLTVTEFSLLRVLLAAPGHVLSREQLVERAYGDGYYITERTVDSHIRRVRRKLESAGSDPIETIYGLGYKLRE